jgi:tryptophan synthase alpha chain
MNRIEKRFAEYKKTGSKALVGFVSAGDPSVEMSKKLLREMIAGGLDVLELGVPFSDPTADGPVIQRSSSRAIAAGVNMGVCLDIVRDIRSYDKDLPVVLFSYYNPIIAYGKRFYEDAAAAGADGVLIVDLPPEEAGELTDKWPGNELVVIHLIAPTTYDERVKLIAAASRGFLYLISRTGVTGTGGINVDGVSRYVDRIRRQTDLPLCVGFGISTPEDAFAMAGHADGIVIGSAFEKVIEKNPDNPDLPRIMGDFVRGFRGALDRY